MILCVGPFYPSCAFCTLSPLRHCLIPVFDHFETEKNENKNKSSRAVFEDPAEQFRFHSTELLYFVATKLNYRVNRYWLVS